jgi:hypothetical protein
MDANKYIKLFLVILILISGYQSAKAEQEKVGIPILLKEEVDKRGILVRVDPEVYAVGGEKGKIRMRFSNLLDDDIFIEIPNPEISSFSINRRGLMGSSVESLVGMRTHSIYDPLFKKLDKPVRSSDGTRKLPITGSASFNCFLGNNIDLEESIGADISFRIRVSGYLRSSGASFHESVEFLVKVIKESVGKTKKKKSEKN